VTKFEDFRMESWCGTLLRYLVVAGDPGGNFTIDTKTGEIKPHDVFNYEKIPGTAQCKGLTLGAPASPQT